MGNCCYFTLLIGAITPFITGDGAHLVRPNPPKCQNHLAALGPEISDRAPFRRYFFVVCWAWQKHKWLCHSNLFPRNNKHDVEIFTEAWCLNVRNLTWYIYLNNKLLFAQENAVWSELCVVYFRICSRCMISVKSSKHGHYEWWNPSQDVSEGAWRHNKSASSLHLARKAQVSNNISEK